MQYLVKLYDKTLQWSQHRHAPRYLVAVSFIEASVFPIPPYFMLAPMALAKPHKALQYALLATCASVLGGLVGYLLGYMLFTPVVAPLLEYFAYTEKYNLVTQQFQQNGFWAILFAGFMPIPFKLIAIGAGVIKMPIASFLFASLIGRGLKFFAVAGLIKFGGLKMEQLIRQSIAKLGLVFVSIAAAIFGFVIFKVI